MSLDLSAAIEAGTIALAVTLSTADFKELASTAITAAAPHIEAAVREQAATEIEAERDAEIASAKPHVCDDADQGLCHTTAAYTASSIAARTVRRAS